MPPEFPKKLTAQLIISAFEKYNIQHFVLCPGSRNAPFNIGFTNIKKNICYSLVDERSAGFFALGIAQSLQKPVAVVCTSGSAVVNLYPAVVEAFYNQIPLIVISADRPSYKIDIGEGQCMHQKNVFGTHALFTNIANFSKKNTQRVFQQIHFSSFQKKPVHFNVPFEEPLYETQNHLLDFRLPNFSKKNNIFQKISENLKKKSCAYFWKKSPKKMLLLGTMPPCKKRSKRLQKLLEKNPDILVLSECTSNFYHPNVILHIDILLHFLSTENQEKLLAPDFLMTAGGNIVSKKIKQFLRNYKPKYHFHIDENNKRDTFFCLTKHLTCSLDYFLKHYDFIYQKTNSNYPQKILDFQKKRMRKTENYFEKLPLCDLKIFYIIHKFFPKNAILHLSNSSVVRYAQFFTWKKPQAVYANRGVAGIEGSISTAIGHSLANENTHFLITGDLSFFYDSNALWNSYLKNNMRIIVINNGGGGIFNILPEPAKTNCLEYFTTPHFLTAEQICDMHKIKYSFAEKLEDFQGKFLELINEKTSQLLEIKTDKVLSADFLRKFYFKNKKII